MIDDYMGEVVVLLTGTVEVVGRLKKFSTDEIELESPRLFVPMEQGGGLTNAIAMAGEQEPDVATFSWNAVLGIQKCSPEIEAGWRQQTSGIQIASPGGIIQ